MGYDMKIRISEADAEEMEWLLAGEILRGIERQRTTVLTPEDDGDILRKRGVCERVLAKIIRCSPLKPTAIVPRNRKTPRPSRTR